MSSYKVNIQGLDTNEITVLKRNETEELFRQFQAGDETAKEKLVIGNLRLVLSVIKSYNNGKNDMNDLFQVGCIGLIKAIDNFDLSVGVMFSTYAVPLISGEVKRIIRDSSVVRVTRSVRDLAYHIMKFKDHFEATYGVEPSTEDILKELDITEYDLREAMDSLKEPVSIFEPIYNDGGDTIYLLDQLQDTKQQNYDHDLMISLHKALDMIKERERNILISRYIIGKTQMELATEMGVSQAQVSRIESSAINNVKKLIK